MARRTRSGRKAQSGPFLQIGHYPAQLRHPFAPQDYLNPDAIEDIHDTALRVLENLGIKVLLPEAVDLLRKAGATQHDDMVMIGRDMVQAALETAPKSFPLMAANREKSLLIEPAMMIFSPGAGCPNATDRLRGRRPGDKESYEEALKLHQSFDVIHLVGPSAEPQDIPAHLRHYTFMQSQIGLTDKPVFVYARGQAQVEESFDMIRLGLNLTDKEFVATPWTKTVINTNSPRQLDRPMSRGIIDFARHGQILVITPFCLAGAMAPITVAGALVLQHAEALAGITLAQIVRPGAPCVYGAFGSNVDMKSGAPAFGTPEHMQMTLGSGQLARHIGLPWRSAAGTAANLADAQAAGETQQSLWAALNANATMTFHAAGWLEGGLTFGYEKFINDIEALQSIAHMVKRPDMDQSALGYDAIEEVQPGGHFFAAAQTMQRYQTAFYPPLVADLANFGTWTENGSITAEDRATKIWQTILAEFKPPKGSEEREGRLLDYIARAREKGGAPIMD